MIQLTLKIVLILLKIHAWKKSNKNPTKAKLRKPHKENSVAEKSSCISNCSPLPLKFSPPFINLIFIQY